MRPGVSGIAWGVSPLLDEAGVRSAPAADMAKNGKAIGILLGICKKYMTMICGLLGLFLSITKVHDLP